MLTGPKSVVEDDHYEEHTESGSYTAFRNHTENAQ